jgi:hypothetical protein
MLRRKHGQQQFIFLVIFLVIFIVFLVFVRPCRDILVSQRHGNVRFVFRLAWRHQRAGPVVHGRRGLVVAGDHGPAG